VGLDRSVAFVCVVSRQVVSWVDWVCAVSATVDFMGWSMRCWSTRWRPLVQVDMAGNDVAEIHVVSMQYENKNVRTHLVCLPSRCVYGPPSSTPHASCSMVFSTSKSRHTRQTRVTGAGWARVTKSQPVPAPQACGPSTRSPLIFFATRDVCCKKINGLRNHRPGYVDSQISVVAYTHPTNKNHTFSM